MSTGFTSRIVRWILHQTKLGILRTELNAHKVLSWFRNQSVVLLLLLPLLGALIGVCLNHGVRHSLGDGASIEAGLLGELLVSLGVALAGVSVIAFSLALFLQQSVSDLYSPQYFVTYSFDRNQKVILTILVALILGQVGYGLYLRTLDEADTPSPELIVPLTLGSLALVFSLLWWQYLHVAKKVTPSAVISFLHREADKQFSAFHKRAAMTVRLAGMPSGESSSEHLAVAYANILPRVQEPLLRPIHALSEVTTRLANRGDGVAAQYGLRAITAILAEYLNARRTSSLVVRSDVHIFAFESDSQSMLYESLEQLNEMGNRFLDSGHINLARSLVDSYKHLSESSIQIKFIGKPHENPIAYQLAFSLKDFVTTARNHGDKEVPFRAIETFAQLGEYATANSDVTLIQTTTTELASIGVYGVASEASFVTEHCLRAECRLIRSLFSLRGDLRVFSDEILQQLFRTHQIAVHAKTKKSDSSYITPDWAGVLRSPFVNLQELIDWIRKEHDRMDIAQRGAFVHTFKSFLDSLYSTLRPTLERTNLGSVYTDTATKLIYQIVRTSVTIERGATNVSMAEPIKMFTWLLGWIGQQEGAATSSRGFEDAIDQASKISMVLMKGEHADDQVFAALDTQYFIIQRALKKSSDSPKYYLSNLMLRVCYCGPVAIKYRRQSVIEKTLSLIRQFEDAQETSGDSRGLRPVQVEFSKWRDSVEGLRKPVLTRDGAAGIATSLVTLKELDTFMVEAWGERFEPSKAPISED